MAQKQYIEKQVLQALLNKLVQRNDGRYLAIEGKAKTAGTADQVKSNLKITVAGQETLFNGSEAKEVNVAAASHSHVASDITDFTSAVNKVISDGGGSTHTHTNKAVLDGISADKVSVWDAKIGTADVEKLVYTNAGVGGTTNVKAALDILVKNVQMAVGEAITNSNNMITLEGRIAELEAANGEAGAIGSLIKANAQAIADMKNAEKEGSLAYSIKANKDEIDAINNETTGILASAKSYADTAAKNAADGKDAAIQAAQAQADKGVTDAATAQSTADTAKANAATAQAAAEAAQGTANQGVSDAADALSAAKAAQKTIDDQLKEGTAGTLAAKIKANADAISTLNGEGDGSVKKTAESAAASAVAGVVAGADAKYDTLKEIADFLLNDTTGAAAMANDIKANADAIEKLNSGKDVAGSVDAKVETARATLQGNINTVAGDLSKLETRVGTNETSITALQGSVATKAESTALQAEVDRAKGIEGGLDARLDVIEGEESQAGSIKKALKDAKDYADGKDQSIAAAKSAAEAAQGDVDALELVVGAKAVEGGAAATGLFKSIADEESRAKGIEDGLAGRISALETFKNGHDHSVMQGNITANGNAITALDGRVDSIETFVANHGDLSADDLDAMLNTAYGTTQA